MKPDRSAQWEKIQSIGQEAAGITHFLWGYLTSAEKSKRRMSATKLLDLMVEQAAKELERQNKREAVCAS